MPTRHSLERTCRKRNEVRNVYSERNVDPFSFCANTSGNFLITGGTTQKRAALILEYISARSHSCPVVVLSGSDELERKLIDNLAHVGRTMKVISPRYRSYSCFFGMQDVDIIKNLIETAQRMNMHNITSLSSFSGAFLKLLRKCGHIPELNSMKELSNNDNYLLSSVAARKGLSTSDVNILSREQEGADMLKFVLRVIESAFSSIHTDSIKKRNSIITLAGERDVVFINTKSKDQAIFNNIIASELHYLVNESFLVVFDEMPLAGSEKLREVISSMRTRGNIDVGLSLVNANTWLGDETETLDANSMIILPSGLGERDIDKLTDCFGKYQHHYVDTDIPIEFGEVIHDSHLTIKVEERKRVRPCDVARKTAVLSGHNGNSVILAERFISQFEGGLTNGGIQRISRL